MPGYPGNLYRMGYVESETVILQYVGGECRKQTSKGCIQGSIVFADDVVLMFSGQSAQVLQTEVDDWGVKNKLRFAPFKTKAMVLTIKLKYDNPVVYINQQEINLVEEIKILGLTIDKRLTFISQVTQTYKKTTDVYKIIARAARVTGKSLDSETIDRLAIEGSHIFTDRSRIQGKVGAALTEWQDEMETDRSECCESECCESECPLSVPTGDLLHGVPSRYDGSAKSHKKSSAEHKQNDKHLQRL
ncbi:hypothetical protein EVAR_62044_1 [Eumeta japonica]|uniref:Reverse transcriptase domain-containing protein n=1 Tax=Eumeta variegata TaxID=151549 RepID=A0A4C1YST7_EUMVA|nr:hypothetical protein EVAR_62044_1 [Eumeta japonica]